MALVVVPPDGDAREHVTRLMAPHRRDDDEATGQWDGWMIGGRFTGRLSGYDATEDPQNWETCPLCGGTGERPGGREEFGDEWYERNQGCNGCQGRGWGVKWPTQFAEHEGDLQRLGDVLPLREDARPWALVLPDGSWLVRGLYEDALYDLDPDLRVVVVDYRF
jgi:hypothetical protein